MPTPQQIADYLKANKDKFSMEALKEKLLKAGASQADVNEGERLALGGAPPPTELAKIRFDAIKKPEGFGAAARHLGWVLSTLAILTGIAKVLNWF